MENKKFTIEAHIELLKEVAEDEAYASLSLNPKFQWAKIIITDDKPNANKQRVPVEEYDNLIKTGLNTPVKMAKGGISRGHDEAFGNPIGVIAHLTKQANKLIALAALWKEERPEDVALLKEMYEEGILPSVSWEILYNPALAEIDEETQVETLRGGLIFNGLAVVEAPAYGGRTSFIAMSAKNKQEEISVDELEKLKARIEELERKLEEQKGLVAEKEKALAENEEELDGLREFKAEVKRVAEEEKKFLEIKEKFAEAGIEKEDEYFTDNRERLLGLSAEALDFMIQEFVAFSEKEDEEEKALSSKKTKVPNVRHVSDEFDPKDPKALAQALRELTLKKDKE